MFTTNKNRYLIQQGFIEFTIPKKRDFYHLFKNYEIFGKKIKTYLIFC